MSVIKLELRSHTYKAINSKYEALIAITKSTSETKLIY